MGATSAGFRRNLNHIVRKRRKINTFPKSVHDCNTGNGIQREDAERTESERNNITEENILHISGVVVVRAKINIETTI